MILVTGATGLLGTHIVCELLANQYEVMAAFRTEKSREKLANILRFYFPDSWESMFARLKWIQLDVLDLVEVEDAVKQCSEVIHCAALVSFHRRDFQKMIAVNRIGTFNIVNACLEFNTRKLVHISSTAAIGSERLPGNDSGSENETNKWSPNENASGYAVSKYSAEKEVWRGIEEGLNAVIVNPSLMVGAGDWNESSLKMLRTASEGFAWYTDGANAFVDARDVATAVRMLLESDVSAQRFLVTGQNAAFKDFFTEVARMTDAQPPRKKAGRFSTSLAWIFSGLSGSFTGKRPSITKETAASAHKVTRYSTDKIATQFPGFRFRTIPEMVENAVKGRQFFEQ